MTSFVCILLRQSTFIQYQENLPGSMAVSSKDLTSSTSQDDPHSVESIQEGEGTEMSKVATVTKARLWQVPMTTAKASKSTKMD